MQPAGAAIFRPAWIGGPAALGDAAAAYDSLLKQVAAGEIGLDIDPLPLARVEQAWP